MQVRNGWRPHRRLLDQQPAALSKDCRFFVQPTRTTSLLLVGYAFLSLSFYITDEAAPDLGHAGILPIIQCSADSRPNNRPGLCKAPLEEGPVFKFALVVPKSTSAINTASYSPSGVGSAVRQSFRWRPKTGHQRFDLRIDLGLVNEQNGPVIKKKLAAEPIPASTKIDLISPESAWSERQVHVRGVAPGRSQRHDGLMPSSALTSPAWAGAGHKRERSPSES